MYPIGYTVASMGLNQIFKNVSGGCFNPSLALAQICWQNLTYYYKEGVDGAYWTPDYAVCYIMGPMIGAFFAGNLFNLQKRVLRRVEEGDLEDSDDEDIKAEVLRQFNFSYKNQINSMRASVGVKRKSESDMKRNNPNYTVGKSPDRKSVV